MLAHQTLTADPTLHKFICQIDRVEAHAQSLLEHVDPELQPARTEDLEAIAEGARRLAALVSALDLDDWYTVAQSAHTLRSPLSGIIGFSQTMLLYPDLYTEGGSTLSAAQRHVLSSIFTLGTEIYRAINNLIDYARVQAGTLDIEHSPYHFEAIARKLAQISREGCVDSDLAFALEIPEDLPMALGDQVCTLHALTNIVSNALQFTENGSITLRVFPAGNMLGVQIIDTGAGIADAVRDALFTPFVTCSRSASGLGLGLAVAQHLLELQGGSLSAAPNPAGGTIFSIYLPTVDN